MKKLLSVLLSLAIIAGGLYGAWIALEYFDNTRAAYREELARSQFLNLAAQARISDLMEENARLQSELDELRSLPVFMESPASDILHLDEDELEEEEEDVGHQVITE